MPYIGKTPSKVPLTSDDIADGTVSNADLAGSITSAKITSLDATKLTGSIADARVPASAVTQHVTATDLSQLEMNQALLAFKVASANQLAKFSMVDQVIDEYQDATGIDAGASTNELAGGATTAKYYEGATQVSPTVTGGTITTISGDYTIHTFTSGTTNYVSDTTQLLDILVLAGGGGGCTDEGGGGGGSGGFKYFSQKSVAAATTSVVVGTGGARGNAGANGVNSSFGALTSTGGGAAGAGDAAGSVGGSGGGASRRNSAAGGAGTANQGYAGGDNAQVSSPTNADSGGGGGGAASVGTNAVASGAAGNGGAGYTEGSSTVYDWTLADGTTATFNVNATGNAYAGGGAAGSEVGSVGTASHGGGTATVAPTANRGGGGGGQQGSGTGNGTAGAAGVVIIRRPTYGSTTLGQNLTLQSVATTAESAPTTADLVVLIEDGAGTATVNTDIKGYVSRNGSAFSTAVTFVDEGDWGTNKRILVARNIDISGITTGTAMKYKLTTHNQSASSKETRIHATSLAWA